MIRLLVIALLLCIGCRLLFRRWPWELLKGSIHSDAEARARALLGVGPRAGREDIIDAHRRLLTRVHPDKGGTGEEVVAANAARDLLLSRLAERH